jgi:DNA-binding transcriptional LysR family regulator
MKFSQSGQAPFDSRQLNAFISLARTGSFTKTARELFLTHSAISHSMRTLETDAGCRLLTRTAKRVVLTEAGEALLHHVVPAMAQLQNAREALKKLNQWGGRRLRVGTYAALSRQLLPALLVAAHQQNPRLQFTVQIVHPAETFECLEKGTLDMVLGERLAHSSEIDFTLLLDSRFQILVPPSHRWATLGRVPREELAREPCLLPDRLNPTRKLIEDYFAEEKMVLNGIAEIESFDVIKELVKLGLGIGILPSWAAQKEVSEGALVPFSPGRRHLTQSLGILRWRSRVISTVDTNFINTCLTITKGMSKSMVVETHAPNGTHH